MQLKILFADDDHNLLKIFQKWSSLKGFQCDLVENGERALQCCAEKNYDIVVMDIDMPKLDGITTACELAKRRGDLKVLILTGLYPEKIEKLPKNIVGILQKPISLAELQNKIFNVVCKPPAQKL